MIKRPRSTEVGCACSSPTHSLTFLAPADICNEALFDQQATSFCSNHQTEQSLESHVLMCVDNSVRDRLFLAGACHAKDGGPHTHNGYLVCQTITDGELYRCCNSLPADTPDECPGPKPPGGNILSGTLVAAFDLEIIQSTLCYPKDHKCSTDPSDVSITCSGSWSTSRTCPGNYKDVDVWKCL